MVILNGPFTRSFTKHKSHRTQMHVDCLGMPCLFKRNKKYGRVTDKETALQVPYFSLQRAWMVMSYNKYCSMYDTKRSAARMRALRRALKSKEKQRGKALQAQKEARTLGVNMAFDNPWDIGKAEDWVFGPDPIEDNIYRCLPQVTLHGMDEGLTQKLNLVILAHAIAEVQG